MPYKYHYDIYNSPETSSKLGIVIRALVAPNYSTDRHGDAIRHPLRELHRIRHARHRPRPGFVELPLNVGPVLLNLANRLELVANEPRELPFKWVLVRRHHALLARLVEAQVAAETNPKGRREAQTGRPGKELSHFRVGRIHDVDSLRKQRRHRNGCRLADATAQTRNVSFAAIMNRIWPETYESSPKYSWKPLFMTSRTWPIYGIRDGIVGGSLVFSTSFREGRFVSHAPYSEALSAYAPNKRMVTLMRPRVTSGSIVDVVLVPGHTTSF